jgi:hypothetical protein
MQMHGVTQEATNKLVYDAGYIKLREASLTYNFSETLGKLPFTTASLSIIGRNLWIIDFHMDPGWVWF